MGAGRCRICPIHRRSRDKMRKIIGIILLISSLSSVMAQSFEKEIKRYRRKQNLEFYDPDSSPLTREERKKFRGHDFYPAEESYRVTARFEATPDSKPFPLGTSRGKTQLYKRLGILHFELKGDAYTLEAYTRVQGFALRTKKVLVFLPVVDETTGDETYGAGRYLHYEDMPKGTEWVIDFNKLYNPYCAYSDRYDCPKVPEANHLPIAIKAGVRDYKLK